jgi:hypothetical protein
MQVTSIVKIKPSVSFNTKDNTGAVRCYVNSDRSGTVVIVTPEQPVFRKTHTNFVDAQEHALAMIPIVKHICA